MGSNLAAAGNDPAANLDRAALAVEALDGVAPTGRSRVWRTEPQGFKDQPWFANQVLSLDCDPGLSPRELMAGLLAVETALGRVRPAAGAEQGGAGEPSPRLRFAPRCIDLDLLLYGNERVRTPELVLPHPRMHLRAFVLVPLLELEPEAVIPGQGRADKALARLGHRLEDDRIYQE